jgi:hypothetical protein
MGLSVYEFPSHVPRSDCYSVKLMGKGEIHESFVHITRCPVQENPLEKILPLLYGRTFSWTSFSMDEQAVEVEITKLYGTPARGVEILPRRTGIMAEEFDGTTVRLILKKPEYLSIRFLCEENTGAYGQIVHGLMLFAHESEEDIPVPDGKHVIPYAGDADFFEAEIIYFGPGVYDLTTDLPNGMLPIHDGQSVYLHGEAFVYGGITGPGSSKVRVYGRGTLCGRKQRFHYPGLPQLLELEPWDYRTNTHRGSHCTVEGITLLDSFNHNLAVPPYSLVKDVKFIGWKVNNDGLRSGDGSVIDHVFMKVSDDHLYAYSSTLIRRSLFWPMWNGAVLQIGWGNYGGVGTRFINNDIINPEWNQWWYNSGVLASQSQPSSRNGDILIQDLRIDGAINSLVNLHFSSRATSEAEAGGFIRNITLRNVNISGGQVWMNTQEAWYDQIAPDIQFDITPRDKVRKGKSLIRGFINDKKEIAPIENICFENVTMGAILLTEVNLSDHIEVDTETTSGIEVRNTPISQMSPFPGFGDGDGYDSRFVGVRGGESVHKGGTHSHRWLKRGESVCWMINLPDKGLYDIKTSIMGSYRPGGFSLLLDQERVGIFRVDPIDNNGYTVHKIVCAHRLELTAGMHQIILKGTEGWIGPDYVELTPSVETSPQVNVQVHSVSVMITQGDNWVGAGLNLRISEKEIAFNSRAEVAINPDERGPIDPLPIEQVHVYSPQGEKLVSMESSALLQKLSLPCLSPGLHTALFSDRKSFWIARFFVPCN